MVHRFLIVSKHLHLSTTKLESDENISLFCIDLLMPLQVHWEVVGLLKKVDYLVASKEQGVVVQEVYRNVFRVALPYAKFETDRIWLRTQAEKLK